MKPMTYREAVKRINKLLGLQKFASYKVAESGGEFVTDGELAIGEPIYIITENGQLPAPSGNFELDDTTKIKIEDGIVKEIKYDMEKEQFVEATLADGTLVKSKTFDVGQEVFVVAPDGKETPAPDGEHELMLKDESGNDVKIKIKTLDGKIYERENVEGGIEIEQEIAEEEMGMTPDLSLPADTQEDVIADEEFKKVMMAKVDKMIEKLESLVTDYEDMKAKVNKFSKEPAGQPVKQPNNIVSQFKFTQNEQFNELLRIRHNLK